MPILAARYTNHVRQVTHAWVMTTLKTGTLPLPTEPSAKNLSTAVLTVVGIGTTTSKNGIIDEVSAWTNLRYFKPHVRLN